MFLLCHTLYELREIKVIIIIVESRSVTTVKIVKFGTPETIAIIDLKIEKFDVTLH